MYVGKCLALVHIHSTYKMIITIIIGLCIWFVVPILLQSRIKKKNNKKALRMLCRILGAVIIVWTLLKFIMQEL